MVKIGATLAKARTLQGKTIADCAAETKIRRDYLQALEDEHFEVIGGEAWVRGFIRAYGRYLGLDAGILLRAYDAQHRQGHSPTAIPGAHNGELPLRERIRRSMPFILGFGLVLIIVGVYLNRGPGLQGKPTEAIAPAPVVEASASAQPNTGQDGSGQGQPGDPGQPSGVPMEAPEVLVKATDTVTLIVSVGEPQTNVVLKANDILEITDEQLVRLHVSDAGAVRIQVNGQPLPSIGADKVGVELTCEKGKVACEARDRN